MCSTVAKQDTASRDICYGSRSSNLNSEPPIMSPSTVDITGNNKEMKLMCSTVVKKDTASCVICCGSRRSEINTETIMSPSTVGIGDNKEMKFDVQYSC